MGRHEIRTAKAPLPVGPYSQGVRLGNLVFTAGQIPVDPATGKLVPGSVGEQTRRVLENVKAVLEEAGARMDDVVKTTVHLSDMAMFAEFNAVYAQYFPDPKPARTTVGSTLGPGVLVEIDAVAAVREVS